jgi:hypothetical protein
LTVEVKERSADEDDDEDEVYN